MHEFIFRVIRPPAFIIQRYEPDARQIFPKPNSISLQYRTRAYTLELYGYPLFVVISIRVLKFRLDEF